MPESSVIIPVYNGWQLTRACLNALAETTAGRNIEVIIVDNASSDATPQEAQALGALLFGSRFKYIRNERNNNFGPANNQGARIASGEYLILLNNDTEPQPGWYDGMMGDFREFPGIAATGPLLIYPDSGLFGHLVQHLGVSVARHGTVHHLYNGIPAKSPLAGKRRFFQIITAACMVMPTKLFADIGMFDENFVNGFEDVDLCARLAHNGWKFTVNPHSSIIHHESQTPGRGNHLSDNSAYFFSKTSGLLNADAPELVGADGFELKLTPWLFTKPVISTARTEALAAAARQLSFEGMKEQLIQNPLWESGYKKLLAMPEADDHNDEIRGILYMLFPTPQNAIAAARHAFKNGAEEKALSWLQKAAGFCRPLEFYRERAQKFIKYYKNIGGRNIYLQAEMWLKNADAFEKRMLKPFFKEYEELGNALGAFAQ